MSYLPEHVYGLIPGGRSGYGLHPLPAHLRRREEAIGVELTKKGEAYVAAAVAEADGVLFLTLDARDRTTLATTIERLINLLDSIEPDPDVEETGDAEPWLGWTGNGPSAMAKNCAHDDREGEYDDREGGDINDEPHDEETDMDFGYYDFGMFIWGGGEDAPRDHSGT